MKDFINNCNNKICSAPSSTISWTTPVNITKAGFAHPYEILVPDQCYRIRGLETIGTNSIHPVCGHCCGSDTLTIYGNTDICGNAHISGKLTVDGLIDPTGLVLDEQASSPFNPTNTTKGLIWIKKEDRGLYYNDSSGNSILLTSSSSAVTKSAQHDTSMNLLESLTKDLSNNIGDLSKLATTNKNNIIEAINEAATTGGADITDLSKNVAELDASMNLLEASSTKQDVSMNLLEASSTKQDVSMNLLEASSTKQDASMNLLEASSTKQDVSLNSINTTITTHDASLNKLESTINLFDGSKANKSHTDASFNLKADQTYVDASFNLKQDKITAGEGLTLNGSALNAEVTQSELDTKANKSHTDASFNLKADQTYVDASFNLKQDKITAGEGLTLNGSALNAEVTQSELDTKANKSHTDASFNLKADQTYVDASLNTHKTAIDSNTSNLGTKANKSHTDASFNLKADQTYVDASFNLKVDQTYVDASLNLKANIANPTFTGTPAAPTANAGTNTTQLATTAFVTTAIDGGGGGGGKWEETGSDIYYNSGKVGIGKNNPSQKLDIMGNIAVSGTVDGVDISTLSTTVDALKWNVNNHTDLHSKTGGPAPKTQIVAGVTDISGSGFIRIYTASGGILCGQPVCEDISNDGPIKATTPSETTPSWKILGIALSTVVNGAAVSILANGYTTARRTTKYLGIVRNETIMDSIKMGVDDGTYGMTDAYGDSRTVNLNGTINFKDSGGDSNYSANERYPWLTFTVAAGKKMLVKINSFKFEFGASVSYDHLGVEYSTNGTSWEKLNDTIAPTWSNWLYYASESAWKTGNNSWVKKYFGGYNSNTTGNGGGWMFGEDSADISPDDVGNYYPSNALDTWHVVNAQYIRFHFRSDSSTQKSGWNIDIASAETSTDPAPTIIGEPLYIDTTDYTKLSDTSNNNTSGHHIGYVAATDASNDSVYIRVADFSIFDGAIGPQGVQGEKGNTGEGITAGTESINTVGTISTGTWQGTKIADNYIASAFVTDAQDKFTYTHLKNKPNLSYFVTDTQNAYTYTNLKNKPDIYTKTETDDTIKILTARIAALEAHHEERRV